MVGPGTGVAPFRAFIQHRSNIKEVGENVLFFGCRHPEHDFLYKEELEKYHKDGIAELYTAFSRAKDQKEYVQHVMKRPEVMKKIWQLLEQKSALFYICGDAKYMAPDVRDALIFIVQNEGSKTKAEAEAYVTKLESGSRLLKDVWT